MSYLAFSSNDRWLVTASWGNNAFVWDLTAPDPFASPLELTQNVAINGVSVSPDSRWVALGLENGTARVYDLNAEDPIGSSLVLRGHEQRIVTLSFSPNSRWLVTGGWDNSVRLWDLNVDSALIRARRLVGRELTPEERKQYLLDEL